MSDPGIKVFHYDPPQYGEIESTYLLGDSDPKPLWKRVLGFIVLLATLVVSSYFFISAFQNGSHRSHARAPPSEPAPPSKPTPPLRGAVDRSCASHPACADHPPDARAPPSKPAPPLGGAVHRSCASHHACAALGLADPCCPTSNGDMLSCCNQ